MGVLTKMGILTVLVTLSAATAFTVWLPGGLDGEEDINAGTREKREDYEYDYYGYDDVLVPPSSTDTVFDLDDNGFVPCQSKDSCPTYFTETTTGVDYSYEGGFCQEIVDQDLGIAGGEESHILSGIVGISTSSIGGINSFGGCHPLACQRSGKCCLLVTFGYRGRWRGCPPSC